MADDETQGPEDTSWWASDAPSDTSLPSTTFDEPLVWPESPAWDDVGGAGPSGFFDALPEPGDDSGLIFPAVFDEPDGEAASDAQWRPGPPDADPEATQQHLGPLAGLGGGAGPAQTPPEAREELPWPAAAGASREAEPSRAGRRTAVQERPAPEPALGSIWSNDLRAEPQNLVGFAGLPAPAIYADTERGVRGPRWRRFDVRPGNAAVIGLIAVVSMVLVGMFLSVRARNDVPTDASQVRPAGDEVAVTGPLNTVSIPPTVTSTTLVPAINIAELVPPTESTDPAVGTGGSSGGGTGAAATTVPARAPAPSGGGGTAATTTPATSPPTTAAPNPPPTTEVTSPPPVTSPPVTAPPDDDTPPTTRRPTPTFTVPTFTIPDFPGTLPRNFPND